MKKIKFVKRKWSNINWKVDSRFREGDDADYSDWQIKGSLGTIYRSGEKTLFVLIPTKKPKTTSQRLIELGIREDQIEEADGEIYVRGTVEDLPKFCEAIGRKYGRKPMTPEQRAKASERMKRMRDKLQK